MRHSNRGQGRVLIALALCICASLYAQTVPEAGVVTGSVAKTAPGTAAGKAMEAVSGQLSQAAADQAAPQAAQPTPQTAPTQVQSVQLPEPSGEVPLRVMVNKSILVNTTEKLKRVSVTDPAVADALVVTPNQVLVHGRAPGEVSLILWNDQEQSRAFDLRVDVDSTAAAEEIQKIFPVTASSATTSLGGCTVYMIPSSTSGVASNFSSERTWKTHCCSRFLTFSGVICESALWRWLIIVPEYVSQF